MKKIFQKNQIAITALAIMIAVAGYLNFTEQNTSSDGTKKTAGSVETIDTMDISDGDSLIKEKAKASKDVSKSLSKNSSENAKETQTDASSETIGDAVLTQAQVSEYVAGARMEREQTHSKTKESLNEIINSTSVSEDAKKEAVDKLTELADIHFRNRKACHRLNRALYLVLYFLRSFWDAYTVAEYKEYTEDNGGLTYEDV